MDRFEKEMLRAGKIAAVPLPVEPMPAADPSLVIAWLRRLSAGAILGMSPVIVSAVVVVLRFCRAATGDIWLFVAGWLGAIAGCAGVWLLASGEPGNRWWRWYLRWPLRAGTMVYLALAVVSIIFWERCRYLPETRRTEGVFYAVNMAVVSGLWICLFRLLRLLARRIGDDVLRKCFGAMAWVIIVLTVLGLAFVLSQIGQENNGTAATEPSTQETAEFGTVTSKPGVFGFLVIIHGWWGWMMWRLSRRLRSAARKLRMCLAS